MCAPKSCGFSEKHEARWGASCHFLCLLASPRKQWAQTGWKPSGLPDVITACSKGLLPAYGAAVGIHQGAKELPAYKQAGQLSTGSIWWGPRVTNPGRSRQ